MSDARSSTAHMDSFREMLIDPKAFDDQREYLRSTKKTQNMTVRDWIKRIKVINGYLPLMELGAMKFTEEELIRYLIKPNIPRSWVKDFKIGKGLTMTSILEVLGLLKAIEAAETSDRNKSNKRDNKKFKRNNDDSRNKSSDKDKNGKQKFKNKYRLHPQGNHKWGDCFKNPNSKNYKGDYKHNKKNNEHHHLCKSKKNKSKSSQKKEESDSSDNSWSSKGEEENNSIIMEDTMENKSSTKRKMEILNAELIITVSGHGNFKAFVALADTGTSATLISTAVAGRGEKVKNRGGSTKWHTKAGEFITKEKCKINKLKLPQFTSKQTVAFEAHVFDKERGEQYDVILGRDFMKTIGLNILYNSMQFQWGGIKVLMVPKGFWQKSTMHGFQHFENNKISKNEIYLLDANYQKAYLKEVVNSQPQLTNVQQKLLFK